MFQDAFLHIGLHKTGTTSFQSLLFEQRESLLNECDTCYPSLRANLSRPLYSAFCQQPLGYAQNILVEINTESAAAADRENTLDHLSREFETASASRLVMSGEDMSLLNEAEWQDLRQWLNRWARNITIICVVREPISWSRSNAQSAIRGGATLDDINSNPPLPKAREKLTRVISVFGRENIRVFNYDDLCDEPGGLMAGLARTVGIDPEWIRRFDSPGRNRSMTREAAQLISVLNTRAPLMQDGHLGEGRANGDIQNIINETAGEPFRLEPGADDIIRQASDNDLVWLAEEFGVKLVPTLTAIKASQQATHAFSEASVESLAAQLADRERMRRNNASLTNQVHRQTDSLAELRRELEAQKQQLASEQQHNEQLSREKSALSEHASNLADQLSDREGDLESIRASTSWRVTAPLRWLASRLSRLSPLSRFRQG